MGSPKYPKIVGAFVIIHLSSNGHVVLPDQQDLNWCNKLAVAVFQCKTKRSVTVYCTVWATKVFPSLVYESFESNYLPAPVADITTTDFLSSVFSVP